MLRHLLGEIAHGGQVGRQRSDAAQLREQGGILGANRVSRQSSCAQRLSGEVTQTHADRAIGAGQQAMQRGHGAAGLFETGARQVPRQVVAHAQQIGLAAQQVVRRRLAEHRLGQAR